GWGRGEPALVWGGGRAGGEGVGGRGADGGRHAGPRDVGGGGAPVRRTEDRAAVRARRQPAVGRELVVVHRAAEPELVLAAGADARLRCRAGDQVGVPALADLAVRGGG